MFPVRYFAPRYFAPRYWPNVGVDSTLFAATGVPKVTELWSPVLAEAYAPRLRELYEPALKARS